MLYLLLLVAVALPVYVYVLAFPVLALVLLGRTVVFAINSAWTTAAWNGAGCLVFMLAAILIYRVRPPTARLLQFPLPRTPRLMQEIETIRQQFSAPCMEEALLDEGVDVRVVRTPRTGYPFGFRVTLILGLAAMLTMPRLHVTGLLARRMGQLANHGSSLIGWLASLRYYTHAIAALPRDWRRPGNLLLRPFFAWYAPLYDYCVRRAVVLDELQADACMTGLVNGHDVAELLSAQAIAARYISEHHTERVLSLARKKSAVAPVFFASLARTRAFGSSADRKRWLGEAFETGPQAFLPSLKQRLAALDYDAPRLPKPHQDSAAIELFGPEYTRILAAADKDWAQRIAPRWKEVHEKAQREQRRLRQLLQKSRSTPLSLAEATGLAALVERCFGKERARPHYRQLLARFTEDAGANYAAGRFLLSIGDSKGVEAVWRAAQLDSQFALRAEARISEFRAACAPPPQTNPEQPSIVVSEGAEAARKIARRKRETADRKPVPENAPAGGKSDREPTLLEKALSKTADRTSVTAARVQNALTDSAIRRAITGVHPS